MNYRMNYLDDNSHHSVRADVNVIGSKVDNRTEAFARISSRLDDAARLERELFAAYEKAQADLRGVGVEISKRMDGPQAAAYSAWLSEEGGRAEGPGEAPIPIVHEDNS